MSGLLLGRLTVQLLPPSSVRATPPTSTPTHQRSGFFASSVIVRARPPCGGVTGTHQRSAPGIFANDSISRQERPPSVLRKRPAGWAPAKIVSGSPGAGTISQISRPAMPVWLQLRPPSVERKTPSLVPAKSASPMRTSARTLWPRSPSSSRGASPAPAQYTPLLVPIRYSTTRLLALPHGPPRAGRWRGAAAAGRTPLL